jgi:tetratricopeptide (TPR) repeat protein
LLSDMFKSPLSFLMSFLRNCAAALLFLWAGILPAEAIPQTYHSLARETQTMLVTWERSPLKFRQHEQLISHLLHMYLWTKDNFEPREESISAGFGVLPNLARKHAQGETQQALIGAYQLLQHDYVDALKTVGNSPKQTYLRLTRALIGETSPHRYLNVWHIQRREAAQLARQFPRLALAQAILAEAILEQEPTAVDLKQAAQALELALKLEPKNLYYRYQQGQLYFFKGQEAQARQTFNELAHYAVDSPIIPEAIGNFYAWMREPQSAGIFYHLARQHNPQQLRLYRKLETLVAQDSEQVLQVYLDGLSRFPNEEKFFLEVLNRLSDQESPPWQWLFQDVQQRLKPAPKSPWLWFLLAESQAQQQQLSQARLAYEMAYQLQPQAPTLFGGLLSFYWEIEDLQALAALLQRAEKTPAVAWDALYWSGMLDLRTGQNTGAVDKLSRALKQRPEQTRVRYALAMAYRVQGQYPQAREQLMQLLGQTSEKAGLLSLMADTYLQEQNYPLAERYYLQVLALSPYDPAAHFYLGNIFSEQGRYAEAFEAYERAILINPQDLDTRNNMGNVYLKARQIPAAVRHFELLLRMRPDYATAYYNLACAYALNRQPEPALRYLRNAIALDKTLKTAAAKDPDLDTLKMEEAFRLLLQ